MGRGQSEAHGSIGESVDDHPYHYHFGFVTTLGRGLGMADLRIYSKRRIVVIGLIIGIGSTIAMLMLFGMGTFDFLENRSIDWRFLMRGEIEADPRIVIISIDEASFSALNQKWPWPRTYFAQLIDRLRREGAKTIGIDIIMSEPYPGDEALVRSAKPFGHIVFPSKFEETTTRMRWKGKEVELKEEVLKGPIGAISDSADVGYLNLPHDGDGFVRRFTPVRLYQDEVYGSFALKIVARFLEIPLGDLKYLPFNQLRIGDRSIPLNHYDSAYINFAGPAGKFERVSFSQVIEGLYAPGSFKDKIVLVGSTFLDSKDFFPTPFVETRKGGKYPLFGVEIQANIINTILQGRFIKPLSPLSHRLIIFLGGILLTLLSLKLSPLKGAFSVSLIIIAYTIASIWLFARDILMPTTAPVLTFAGVFLSQVVVRYFTEEREKRQIRGMFQKYVSPDIVDQLIEDPAKLRLGGEKRELSVLFSDIRGFTSISERLAPEEILSLLNHYLSAMTAVVLRNGGMLDKYVGDAIMAVFGAPLELENHALLACKTALEMMEELRSLQQGWENESKPILDIGIGINTGEMVMGNVGSPKRMDYTVIGDNVNLASRLEGVNKELGTHIIISGSTYERVKRDVTVRGLGEIKVKGKETQVPIYELLRMN
jgi:adenylate cyclase